jgi:hypothetical protein
LQENLEDMNLIVSVIEAKDEVPVNLEERKEESLMQSELPEEDKLKLSYMKGFEENQIEDQRIRNGL